MADNVSAWSEDTTANVLTTPTEASVNGVRTCWILMLSDVKYRQCADEEYRLLTVNFIQLEPDYICNMSI